MKTIYKILLVPVVIFTIFAIISLVFWFVGLFLIETNLSIINIYDRDFVSIIVVGGLHIVLFLAIGLLLFITYTVFDEFNL